MAQHHAFMAQIISLIDYAERSNLSVAALALNAADEVIAPSLDLPAPASSGLGNVVVYDFRATAAWR